MPLQRACGSLAHASGSKLESINRPVHYRFKKLFNNTKPISAPLGTDFREGIEAR